MELSVGYRPMNGLLTVHNLDLEDRLELDDADERVLYQQDSTDEAWHLLFAVYDEDFLAMTALGVHDQAQGWNCWLSFYLPDDVVSKIHDLVSRWDDEFARTKDDMGQLAKLLLLKRETVEF